jgi:DNA-binding transcriptional MerR regulator
VSEVAARTGFTPSAVRYYDQRGLVPAPARSGAGYRLYDDHSVERLEFISRAKRLGLRLDDITDLLCLWDGEECGPVQSRLAEMVTAKLNETQQGIDELSALAVELTALSTRLEHQAPHAGPCDERCACVADDPAADTVPVVCDLRGAGDTHEERLAAYRRLFAGAFVGRDRTAAGIRFRFRADAGVEALVRELADREKRCCAFFSFTITIAGGEVLWDATVIDDGTARNVLDEWFDLPETLAGDPTGLRERFAGRGLVFTA